MAFLDQVPYPLLAFVTIFLLLAPFVPEPHLVQKWKMLQAGTLRRPIDIFDVLFHLAPLALLVLKIVRDVRAGT